MANKEIDKEVNELIVEDLKVENRKKFWAEYQLLVIKYGCDFYINPPTIVDVNLPTA